MGRLLTSIINKKMDNYYTYKLMDYMKQKIELTHYVRIIYTNKKDAIKVYFNYRDPQRELKENVYIMTMYKKDSFINITKYNDEIRKLIIERIEGINK